MVKTYTKRRYRKLTQTNKRNVYRKRPMIPKPMRFKADEYHTVFFSTENVNSDFSIFNSDSVFTAKGKTFAINQMVNYIQWQRLFEEYRLNRVVVTFDPVQITVRNRAVTTSNPTTPIAGATQVPFCYYFIDRNDDAIPTNPTRDQFKSVRGCVRKPATQQHVISFTPSTLTPVYQSTDTDGKPLFNYMIDYQKKWVQNNLAEISSDTPYWGIKYGIEPATPLGGYNMRVSIKYYVSFRKKK